MRLLTDAISPTTDASRVEHCFYGSLATTSGESMEQPVFDPCAGSPTLFARAWREPADLSRRRYSSLQVLQALNYLLRVLPNEFKSWSAEAQAGSALERIQSVESETDATSVQRDDLEQLSHLYEIRAPQDFCAMLAQHAYVSPYLKEAARRISSVFEDRRAPVIEISRDPAELSDVTFRVLIWSDLCVNDALRKLDELDENWYLDQPQAVRDLVVFDILYR